MCVFRFGKVPAIKLTSDVSAGDEVTVSYDYSLDDAPPWYQELFTQVPSLFQFRKKVNIYPQKAKIKKIVKRF